MQIDDESESVLPSISTFCHHLCGSAEGAGGFPFVGRNYLWDLVFALGPFTRGENVVGFQSLRVAFMNRRGACSAVAVLL